MRKICLPFVFACFLAVGGWCIAASSHAFAAEESSTKGGEGGKAEGGKSDSKGKKKEGDEVMGGRFAGDPVYVHIAPIVLPVINENGVEQLVTILLDVQVKDMDAATALHSNMPRVRDALMRNLYGGLGQGALRNGKLVSVGKVKTKAIAAICDILGKENVRDVLVQGVSQRML